MANLYVEMFLPDSSRAILIPEDWQPCFFSHAGCFYFNYMLFYNTAVPYIFEIVIFVLLFELALIAF